MSALDGTQPVWEAIAAHPVLLDQRHLRLDRGGDIGADQARRACADNDEIAIEARRLGKAAQDPASLGPVEQPASGEREYRKQQEGAYQGGR